jgi:trimeric autotransporter adhesin
MKLSVNRIYLALIALICGIGIAFAVAPPAGSVIGNQATASYTDSTGAPRTTTSNLVQTTVAQVNAFTLTQDQTKSVAPGGTVYFPHTITNTGNGPDTYSLAVADGTVGNGVNSVMCTGGVAGAATPAGCNVFVYPDTYGTGVPDMSNGFLIGTALTPPVAAGNTYKFVVAMQWPAAQTTNPTPVEKLSVSATSQGGTNGSTPASTPTITNTDTINVTNAAVINVTKALSKTTGNRSTAACVAPYGTVAAPSTGCENLTVTLSYTNTGGSAATVTITDLIDPSIAPTPPNPTVGFRYVAGSGKWSGCTGTALTDAGAAEAAACGLTTYDWAVTTANKVTAVIPNVAPGQSGTISFDLNVSSTAPTGTTGTSNTASFSTPTQPATPTNTATYTVASTAGVVANNKTTASTNAAGAGDNEVTLASAPQGASIWFKNVVWNTGSDIDTFDMTTTSTTFPAGTSIAYYSDTGTAAGVTGSATPSSVGSPLTDSTGNGIVDTGPIAAGAYKVVWTKIDLQPNTTLDAPASFNLVKRATSKNDPAVFDEVTDKLTDIIEKTVDLANGAIVGAGTQPNTGTGVQGYPIPPPATPPAPFVTPAVATTNNPVQPGSKTRFNLTLAPSTADSFDFSAWNDYTSVATFTSAFGTGTSAGYSVAYYAGVCPAIGTAISGSGISNTGVIIPGIVPYSFCAEITVPASAAAGTVDIYFRAISPVTGKLTAPYASWDVKHDAFKVAATSVVTITPDRNGTTFPGGNVVYPHQVCNVGNTAAPVTITYTNSNTAAGFTTAMWLDVNNNGNIDSPPDTAIATGSVITVPANGCLNILDNTFSPSGAANGVTNATTIVASVGGTPVGTVTDTTSITVSDIGLVKEQREVTCTGGAAGVAAAGVNGTWVAGNLPGKTNPGACIQYRITATNSGSAAVTGLVISDTTPNYTTYNTAACTASANTGSVTTPTVATSPANGATGNVASSSAAVPSLGSVQLVFCVKVDS